ncbi:DUF2971 domain-containing protein [Pseudomonas sp. NPDC087817]|uniref:DUF2971 domain-containing protein n=1 Tax=Pseudomonas sp. NPDC087817 TaxID=3364451 RepID=UPI00380E526B
MIINVTDHNKYLYHYTSAATAINSILKYRTLRLGEYRNTNDPKESKNWLFDFVSFEQKSDRISYDRNAMSAWLSDELKRNTRLTCFSLDTGPLTGNHLQDIFNRGFCKPRMWAQYAEKHTGVCLVFNRESLEKEITTQLAMHTPLLGGAVQYKDRGIARDIFEEILFSINTDDLEKYGRDRYPAIHLRKHYRELFFEKMSDWKAENEFRWVAFAKTTEPLDVKFGSALVGMMFGEDTAEEDKKEMSHLTSGMGVEMRGLKWKNHSPWYDFERQGYRGPESTV